MSGFKQTIYLVGGQTVSSYAAENESFMGAIANAFLNPSASFLTFVPAASLAAAIKAQPGKRWMLIPPSSILYVDVEEVNEDGDTIEDAHKRAATQNKG